MLQILLKILYYHKMHHQNPTYRAFYLSNLSVCKLKCTFAILFCLLTSFKNRYHFKFVLRIIYLVS